MMGDHCCKTMQDNLGSGETAILYVPKWREYGLPVLDGGSSYILITHGPWCGITLPPSLRNRWFDLIESQGFEPDDPKLPESLRSDVWWRTSP